LITATQPLLDQELSEANEYLVQFDKAHPTVVLFFRGSTVATLALPLFLLANEEEAEPAGSADESCCRTPRANSSYSSPLTFGLGCADLLPFAAQAAELPLTNVNY
jgi:hypothetical protein